MMRRRWTLSISLLAAAVLVVPFAPAATATTPAFTAVAMGGGHTCAITGTGGVQCWGANRYGELGDGTQTDRSKPVNVLGLTTGVRAIAAGGGHTCALLDTGGVKCWGDDGDGQLGNGGDFSEMDSPIPVGVSGLASGVASIAAAGEYTCALLTSGGVKCWGFEINLVGTSPVDFPGFGSGFVAIAAGGNRFCALTSSGGVMCQGENIDGLGLNYFDGPVSVPGLTEGVVALAAGGMHTCALLASGGLKCWGENFTGQLGLGAGDTGTGDFTAPPLDVVGLSSGVTNVAAGSDHTCAVTTNGGAKCWGYGNYGQLGTGDDYDRSAPADVVGLASGVRSIAAGGLSTCALLVSGRLKCWGDNSSGQLGFGTATDEPVLVPVNVLSLAAQTIALSATKAQGKISRGTSISFTATARPPTSGGVRPSVRFAVYRLAGGAWRLAVQKTVVTGSTGRATLRWTFSTAGSWYVKAMALGNAAVSPSPWSSLRYTVR